MEKLNISFINKILYLVAFLLILLIFNALNLLDRVGNIITSLTPFYLAFFISWISQPIIDFFVEKLNIKRSLANILAILVNILILLAFFFILLPLLVVQLWDLINNGTSIIDNFQSTVESIANHFNVDNNLITIPFLEKAKEILNTRSFTDIISSINFDFVFGFAGNIASAFTNTTMVLFQIFIAFMMTFYFIGDFNDFVQRGLALLFVKSKDKHREVFIDVTRALFGYFRGLFLVCLFISIIVSIGASLLGVQSPLLFGIIAGIFNVIPYLGPVLGGIPLFIVSLASGFSTGLLSLAVIFGAQFIESNFLQPKIMAKSTNLHPVTVMVGLIIFSQLFGFVGMLISTPTLAIISVIIRHSKLDIRI